MTLKKSLIYHPQVGIGIFAGRHFGKGMLLGTTMGC